MIKIRVVIEEVVVDFETDQTFNFKSVIADLIKDATTEALKLHAARNPTPKNEAGG